MPTSLDAALGGMLQQQRNLELIAGNLANVNTIGYKRASVRFQDVLDTATVVKAIEGNFADTENAIAPSEVEFEVIERIYTQGSLIESPQPLDVAVSGRGFFRLKVEDGSFVYSRDGGFRLDAQSRLVTHTGALVDPPITFPPLYANVRVLTDGSVMVRRAYTAEELAALPQGAQINGVDESIGRIGLTRFSNLVAVKSIGNSLYIADEGAGVIDGFPGDPSFGVVQGGFLEASNVDVAREMVGLIIATRVYQLNVAAYKTIRDMLDDANELLA